LFFVLAPRGRLIDEQKITYAKMRAKAIPVYLMLSEEASIEELELATVANGAICHSNRVKKQLESYLLVKIQKQLKPYKIQVMDDIDSMRVEDQAEELFNQLTYEKWHFEWMPDGVMRFFGYDSRFGTQIRQYLSTSICSTNQSGYLIFGPYMAMPAGNYNITIKGVSTMISGARMDVAVNGGSIILGESPLGEADSDGCMVSLPITLDESCSDLEIRVWVDDISDITIGLIEIIPEEPVAVEENNHVLLDESEIVSETESLVVENEIITEDVDVVEEPVEMSPILEELDETITNHLGKSGKSKKQRRNKRR
jgi:hypothetical protein